MKHESPERAAAEPLTGLGRAFPTDMLEHLVVPTFVIDTTGRVVVWNKACERLTGLAAQSLVGTTDHWRGFYADKRPCLADFVLRSDFAAIHDYYSDFSKFGLNDFGVAVETWCDLPQAGRRVYLAIDAGPIYDADGTFVAVVETLRDITAQREAQDALATLASLDGLTGLANRRSFDEALAREMQRSLRSGKPLSLLMMDIDGFKLFNDSYGHCCGDDCLKRVAQTVKSVVRLASDVAARYGGEEFAVILPETDLAGTLAVAERIRSAVEDLGILHQASSCAPVVTISIGGAASFEPHAELPTLLAAADAALYRAKHGGRNRTVVEALATVSRACSPPLRDCA